MEINIDAIHTTGIQNCIHLQELQQVMTNDDHLQQLRQHIIRGIPKAETRHNQK